MYSKLPVLFLMFILIASVAGSTIPASNATLVQRDLSYLNDNHLTALYGESAVCGDHICAPGEWDKLQASLTAAQLGYQGGRNVTQTMPHATAVTTPVVPPVTTTNNTTTPVPSNTTTTSTPMPTMTAPTWTTKTGTVTSVQDPGIGHESHQLAIILPPDNGNIYNGVISWTSSEPLQIVQLSGPLAQGDDKGQPIWTVDLKTKYALTLVNVNETTGSFEFTGNALALHFSQPIPFTATYAVSYTESSPSDTVKSGTLTSIQDPGQGHQTHQLAIILPPSAKPYHGILTYSASEPVQLVTLIPINGTDKNGQLVYTIDGQTWYGLVFVDYYNTQMGTWSFAGNALAVHTVHTTPFQVSYSVAAHQ
ncbi:MAG: hypothetical protein ACREAN_06950 [Nitrosopumilaceae archaeon]